MKSEIDNKLTEEEKNLLAIYRNQNSSDLKRQTRLSFQYAIGTGIFTAAAIFYDPKFALIAYLIFIIYLVIRIAGAKKSIGAMPSIIEKYEEEIKKLKSCPHPIPQGVKKL